MAQDENSWWSSWTTGILENVREKTTTALEFVQSDLSEFVNTIQHDTSVVIADSATAVNRSIQVDETEKNATSGKVKQGFSDILTSISTSLHQAADKTSKPTSSEDENKTDDQRSTSSTMPAVYDRTQAKLQEMQTNPETYSNEPDSDGYETWCATFNLDSKKGEISELLVNNPDVRRLYTKFVPSVQSHSTFWHRYFYKLHEIETANKRLADIVERASRNDSQDLGWDDEDDEETNSITATPKDEELTSIDTNVITDNHPRHEVLQEETKLQQNNKPHCIIRSKNSSADKIDTTEAAADKNCGNQNKEVKNIVHDAKSTSAHNNHDDTPSKDSSSCLETKSEGDSSSRKSDSSDSSSWIKVLDKEGTSSSSSVVVVNDGKELDSDEQLANEVDDDDDDDDFDFNEDVTNEDVEKLVQSITANEIDSEDDDWEDWE
ncbi:BSD domain-containing protein 1-like [Dendronephthya gigantea]|uniref:BSD domain-containing protein 1-like n=1 Tax=Dendronephthya gigantea TaxID=151771 RepID=UPI00106B70F5|nr:BSD domain-containing protein 1-like [Dendronephthya gigantea]